MLKNDYPPNFRYDPIFLTIMIQYGGIRVLLSTARFVLGRDIIRKAAVQCTAAFCKDRHRPTLPHVTAVPSALAGLTSLFGMGRGGHRRYRHLNTFQSKNSKFKIQKSGTPAFLPFTFYFSIFYLTDNGRKKTGRQQPAALEKASGY